MSQISRFYIPDIQYVSNIEKLNDDTAKKLIIKIAESCLNILDIDSLTKAFDKKFKDDGIIAPRHEILKPIYNAKNKVEAMIQLAFLVNKCTKARAIKSKEKGKPFANKDKFEQIYSDMNSNKDKNKNNALKELTKLSEKEFVDYYMFYELEKRKEIFYDIKHKLLSAIIKELGENEELYKDYIYGFIRDEDSYVFAINIPEHLGTYQFHIQPNYEKEILYDIDCYEVQHEYEQLAEGESALGKMNLLFTKEELGDVEKIEENLTKLKVRAKKLTGITNENQENIFRKIFLYSILLGKNPMQELYDANSKIAFEFINEEDCGLSDFTNKKTVEDQRRYKIIMENLRKIKKIFISSPNTIDSKVSIEALIREGKKFGISEDDIQIIEIKPGSKVNEQGIYINLNKDGCDFNHRNRIIINPNESKREVSTSAILSRLGFDVPRDVVLYANRADMILSNPRNAYMLASSGMNGKQIYSLCQELNRQGTNLREASLSDEQLERHEVKECKDNMSKRIEKIKSQMKYVTIGEKRVAIYEGKDPIAAYIAYDNRADIIISVNSKNIGNKEGVIFAIQSDPKKCDLPLELIQWAIRIKRKEMLAKETKFNYIDDMLIKNTRIICGGDTRPDLMLEDRREVKEGSYKDEIIKQILDQIMRSTQREYGMFLDESTITAINFQEINVIMNSLYRDFEGKEVIL